MEKLKVFRRMSQREATLGVVAPLFRCRRRRTGSTASDSAAAVQMPLLVRLRAAERFAVIRRTLQSNRRIMRARAENGGVSGGVSGESEGNESPRALPTSFDELPASLLEKMAKRLFLRDVVDLRRHWREFQRACDSYWLNHSGTLRRLRCNV